MDGPVFDEVRASAMQKQLIELALNPIGLLRRRWLWMALGLVIGLAATAVLVASVEPSFKATSTVLVSSQQIPESFVKSTVRGLDSLSNVNALVGEVLSQRNLSELIERYSLYAETGRDVPTADLVGRLRRHITITPQRNVNEARQGESSSIFVISYEGETPQAAADVANSLASILIAASLDKRSEQARRTTDFLRRELERAEGRLAEVNREISEFNRTYRGELPSDLQPLLQKLERLEQSRQTLSEQISAAEDRVIALESADSTSDAEKQLLELRMELNSQMAIHTDEHPNVIALQRRIERMEAELGHDPAGGTERFSPRGIQIAETRHELESLRERMRDTEAQIREIDTRVDRIPTRNEEFSALEQRAEVLRETHLEFMRKVKEAELAETMESAQQGPQVSLLDQAQPPSAPEQSSLLFLIPGVLGAFALGALIGVALELIDPVVLSPDHFEALGPAPVLGSVYRL